MLVQLHWFRSGHSDCVVVIYCETAEVRARNIRAYVWYWLLRLSQLLSMSLFITIKMWHRHTILHKKWKWHLSAFKHVSQHISFAALPVVHLQKIKRLHVLFYSLMLHTDSNIGPSRRPKVLCWLLCSQKFWTWWLWTCQTICVIASSCWDYPYCLPSAPKWLKKGFGILRTFWP